jgi:hypothetical protein
VLSVCNVRGMVFPYDATKADPQSASRENMWPFVNTIRNIPCPQETSKCLASVSLLSLGRYSSLYKCRRLQWIKNVARMDGDGMYTEL